MYCSVSAEVLIRLDKPQHVHTFPLGLSVIMSLAWNGLITNKTAISGENKDEKIKVLECTNPN